jgi:hypothetical protein
VPTRFPLADRVISAELTDQLGRARAELTATTELRRHLAAKEGVQREVNRDVHNGGQYSHGGGRVKDSPIISIGLIGYIVTHYNTYIYERNFLGE